MSDRRIIIECEIKPARLNIAGIGRATSFIRGPNTYTGIYEITPSEEAQRLSTANTRMENDIIVNPIPTNYGRITWDGSIITIT